MRTLTASRLSDLDRLTREAAAAVCKELNAKEFAKLGEPLTWFDLQGAAAYLAVSEQTLSRYVKERTAHASAKVGTAVASIEMIWTPGLGPAASSLSGRRRIPMPIERKIIPIDDVVRVAELVSVAGCDFDIAQILMLRSTDGDRPLCSRGLHRWAIIPEQEEVKWQHSIKRDSRLWCGCSRQPIPYRQPIPTLGKAFAQPWRDRLSQPSAGRP
jgi:hypothetical protein